MAISPSSDRARELWESLSPRVQAELEILETLNTQWRFGPSASQDEITEQLTTVFRVCFSISEMEVETTALFLWEINRLRYTHFRQVQNVLTYGEDPQLLTLWKRLSSDFRKRLSSLDAMTPERWRSDSIEKQWLAVSTPEDIAIFEEFEQAWLRRRDADAERRSKEEETERIQHEILVELQRRNRLLEEQAILERQRVAFEADQAAKARAAERCAMGMHEYDAFGQCRHCYRYRDF